MSALPRVEAVEGDLTTDPADAIVNAANSLLLGGGGVDGAIHAAAGPRLLEACRRLRRTSHRNGLPVGEAVATDGFDLPARWVVHTVGPNRHRGQTDPALLAACFTSSLDVAANLGARTVAFPAISAGAYGWDVDDVARIAVRAVRGWGTRQGGSTAGAGADLDGTDPGRPVPDGGPAPVVEQVRFVLASPRALDAFARALADVTP